MLSKGDVIWERVWDEYRSKHVLKKRVLTGVTTWTAWPRRVMLHFGKNLSYTTVNLHGNTLLFFLPDEAD